MACGSDNESSGWVPSNRLGCRDCKVATALAPLTSSLSVKRERLPMVIRCSSWNQAGAQSIKGMEKNQAKDNVGVELCGTLQYACLFSILGFRQPRRLRCHTEQL